MNDFKKCLRIESSIHEDNLMIPKKGEMSLEIKEQFGVLKLRFQKKSCLFDSAIEQKV